MKKNADKEQIRRIREHTEETDIRFRFTMAIRKFMEKHSIREEDYADKAEKLWESFEDLNKQARELDPTARNYEEMLWNRLNPVRIKLNKLEKRPPSIKRFKDILRLMTSEVLADAAHGRGEFISSDILLKSFRLLAVTPKTLRWKSVKPGDLLFTRKECEACLMSYTLFIDAVLEEERAMLLRVPTKERKRLQKNSGDNPAENKTARKARLFAHLFEMAGKGKYRYTGKHFNYLIKNRNTLKTVSTPDKVGTPDTLGKIFEYYIVRAWALEKGRNNAKKINELMRKFIDEVEIESCRDLFLNIYKSSNDTKAKLLAEQKATTPDDAKKFDDQIALADSLSKMMTLELLRHKIDPDAAAQELAERSKDRVRDGMLADNKGKHLVTENPVDPNQCPIGALPTGMEFQKQLYCKRFKVSKDFKYIYDSVHTRKYYPNIQNLENAGNKVLSILKELFMAYGRKSTDGWVYSGGGSWGPHFGKMPYSLFKSQQISVRKNPETNKSEWRIIPLAEFDEESSIGLHSKRKKHSNQKNNF